jgi:hypothetical protein
MGAFFPIPGPFSPLLPMYTLFFAHLGVTGLAKVRAQETARESMQEIHIVIRCFAAHSF